MTTTLIKDDGVAGRCGVCHTGTYLPRSWAASLLGSAAMIAKRRRLFVFLGAYLILSRPTEDDSHCWAFCLLWLVGCWHQPWQDSHLLTNRFPEHSRCVSKCGCHLGAELVVQSEICTCTLILTSFQGPKQIAQPYRRSVKREQP